jgi:PAS domain S-box-containing protein
MANTVVIRRSIAGGVMGRRARRWAGVSIAIVVFSSVRAAASEPRNVLVLHSYEREFEPLRYVADVFQTEVSRQLAEPVHFVEVSLQPARSGEALQERPILEYLLSLFPSGRPDLIVPIGGLAAMFAQQHRRELFPASPMLLTSVDQRFVNQAAFTNNETAVPIAIEPDRLLENVLQVLPETTTIAVVIGLGQMDKIWHEELARAFQRFEGRMNVVWFDQLSFEDMRARAAALPLHSAILYTIVSVDANGVPYTEDQTLGELHTVTNAPIFGWNSIQLGKGIVGGSLIALEPVAQRAAAVAVRILHGESPGNIRTPSQRAAAPVYDWRELQRWSIPEDRLPRGSIVRFRELSPWRRYFWYIVGVGSLCLVEAAFIFAFRVNRVKRARAEQSRQESEARFQYAMQNVASGLYTVDLQGMVTYVNPAAEAMFQWTSAELLGKKMHDVTHYEHPDGTGYPAADCPVLQVLQKGIEVREHEDVFIRKDGSFFPVVFSASPLRKNGGTIGLVVGFRDDTQRREAERAIRESEERFRLVANSAPAMIWMSGLDKRCTYFNQGWLQFTGQPVEAELGDGWSEGVHPDDRSQCLATYTQAFDHRTPFKMEFRLRRYDGEYRWILGTGLARFDRDAAFCGYIGSAVDVTEQKLAETALSGLSRRLMEAQEQERAWIARELHDDLAQKAVALGMQLHCVARTDGPIEPDRVREMSDQVSDLARDIQAVSHRLHSYLLEYFGLANAVTRLCEDLEKQHRLEITLNVDGMPADLPKDIALVLFRVLQESLANVAKHSGVRDVTVTLSGTPHGVQLYVVDQGIGFDPETAKRKQGLGLISMHERLNLVHGEIAIESRPGAGTRICARVPLSMSAAGYRGSPRI